MNDERYPVTVAVKRADGTTENVRVGTAIRSGDGFRLTLGELAIGAAAEAAAPARRPAPNAGGGLVFPPYGRSKGAPIAGASQGDLEFYANGCRRTLADPAKSRWHDKERALLAAIEAEMANGSGGSGGGGDAGFSDDFPPPRTDDDMPF